MASAASRLRGEDRISASLSGGVNRGGNRSVNRGVNRVCVNRGVNGCAWGVCEWVCACGV